MSSAAIWGIIAAWTAGLLAGDTLSPVLVWCLLSAAALLLLLPRARDRGRRLSIVLLCFLAAVPASRRLDASSPWTGRQAPKEVFEGLRNPHYRPLIISAPQGRRDMPDMENTRRPPVRPEWASEPVWNLIQGILFNRREALDRGWIDAFRSAGTAHLLAVSGLHISILLMSLLMILRLTGSGRFIMKVVPTLAVWIYIIAIGAPPSAVRAGLMATAWIGLRDTLRRVDGSRIFPVAVLTALILDPPLVASTGFHLSVAAVAGISIMNRQTEAADGRSFRHRSVSVVRLSLGAQAGVLPIQILVFGAVTPLAMLVNVLAVPLLGIWLPSVPVAIGLGGIGGLPEQVAGAFTEGAGRVLLWWIYLWGSLPGMMRAVQPWTGLVAATGLIAWTRGGRGRLVALAALALTIWSPHLDRGLPRVTFLDVGQGDAIVLETRDPSRVIVIDAGPAWDMWDAGEAVVAAYLKSRGVRTIDLLVASHSDADHIGGMKALIERFEVGAFMHGSWVIEAEGTASRLLRAISESRIPLLLPDSGDRLVVARETWIDVPGGVLTTGRAGSGGENDRSLVLRVEMKGLSILLPGDLEVTGEGRLQSYSSTLRSDILKVAHHGSGDSSSRRFLDLVRPELAVISVGRKNSHGHPDQVVLEQLESSGARIWRTDLSGALVIRPRH